MKNNILLCDDDQGRETPSPGDTPYLCRQRANNAATGSNGNVRAQQEGRSTQEVNEMESGRLLGEDKVRTKQCARACLFV